MSLFQKATMQTAYLKMSLYGGAGSGKTYTSSQVAIGLAHHIGKATKKVPPVMFLDTETGSDWVLPMFEEAGVELLAAKTRAFVDLKKAVPEAEAAGAILLIDSATHFWKELCNTAQEQKRKNKKDNRARLEMPDWNTLKASWDEFTTQYLNAKAHIIVCGRSGSVYEFYENEETHKKEMIEVGTKMAAEKNFAYEPSLLVEMFAEQTKAAKRDKKKVINRALVLKDRGHTLNGREFIEPKFSDFLPHIKRLNIGGAHAGIDETRNSAALFPKDDRANTRYDRDILVEEIQAILVEHYPSTGAADKARKAELLQQFFATKSWTEVEKKIPVHELRERYNALHIELEGGPSRYFPAAEEVEDAIPETGGGAPSGLAMLVGKYADAADLPTLNDTQTKAQAFLNDLSEGDREKASMAYADAAKRIIKSMSGAANDLAQTQAEEVA